MLEAFGFFGFVVACVLLVERPWRNWRVDVAVEKVQAEPAEATQDEREAYKQTAHTQPANVTPQQIMQVHQAGRTLGHREMLNQLYNPVLN